MTEATSRTGRSTLEERLDTQYAPAWRPKAGDKLVGTVTELTERDGAYGAYPIVTIRKENGEELAVHAFHDVLQNELARVAPKHGDVIGIKYEGLDNERGYHRYRVRAAGGDSALSWAKYGAADTAEKEANGDEWDDIPF